MVCLCSSSAHLIVYHALQFAGCPLNLAAGGPAVVGVIVAVRVCEPLLGMAKLTAPLVVVVIFTLQTWST